VETALAIGAVDAVMPTAREAVEFADIVLLCAPLQATVPLLAEIAPLLPDHAVVTDVGSTKQSIVAAAERILPERFVGGHPMAGSEASGIRQARADLFQEAPWLLTPTDRTRSSALGAVEAMVGATGARLRKCSPGDHDRLVATLSHLPHLLAYGLSHAAADLVPETWRGVAAGSFRDGTRVAASNPALWRAVFEENRDAVLASLDAFEQWTTELRAAMAGDDFERVGRLLESAHRARRGFFRDSPDHPPTQR
jgi:prephenate dehydrogenase